MSLRGLPDLQRPMAEAGFPVFFPHEAPGPLLVVPDELVLGERAGGEPDFRLELVRSDRPDRPPAPYGVLDFRVVPRYPVEAALEAVRRRQPDAVVSAVRFDAGFLRLTVEDGVADVGEEMLAPRPLAWNGLGAARFVNRLPVEAALMLKGHLAGEWLGLSASAQLQFAAVAPRVGVQVTFDPAAVCAALEERADEARRLSHRDLAAAFTAAADGLPLTVRPAPAEADRAAFAEAMADRFRERFCAFVAAAADRPEAALRLPEPGSIAAGFFTWDLAVPVLTHRPLVLRLDPFGPAREQVRRHGLEAVLRQTEVPSLDTGLTPVTVIANLPADREDVLSVGATLRFPSRPPLRPQAVVETLELTPPADEACALVRLSPGEPVAYEWSTFVVLQGSPGVRVLHAPDRAGEGRSLELTGDDFPVDFVPLAGAPALLAQCVLRGRCRRLAGGAAHGATFTLDAERPALTLAFPKGDGDVEVEVDAEPLDGGRPLPLRPAPGRGFRFDLPHFPEYGPHRIDVECALPPGEALVAVDLLPEGAPESALTVLSFSPGRTHREWSYFAASPFRAGYRYRLHPPAGQPAPAWSRPLSPFAPLKVPSASEATEAFGT